jgi:hypothetical protein
MNWLFIGSGHMAQVMHDTLLSFEGQNVMGVYSRNKTKLEVFFAIKTTFHSPKMNPMK